MALIPALVPVLAVYEVDGGAGLLDVPVVAWDDTTGEPHVAGDTALVAASAWRPGFARLHVERSRRRNPDRRPDPEDPQREPVPDPRPERPPPDGP